MLSIKYYAIQPDVAAPGVNILAATSPLNRVADNGFAMFSGTSMATPHVSGIVALLIALHPDWSPAAIRSSLVTTGTSISILLIKEYIGKMYMPLKEAQLL